MNDEPTHVHALPFSTSFRGKTNIKENFSFVSVSPSSSGGSVEPHLEAHFRGRKLLGRQIAFPRGYTGAVLLIPESEMPSQPRDPIANAATAGLDTDCAGPECAAGTKEAQEATTVSERSSIQMLSQFQTFVAWEHDRAPASTHFYNATNLWPQIAQVLHGAP